MDELFFGAKRKTRKPTRKSPKRKTVRKSPRRSPKRKTVRKSPRRSPRRKTVYCSKKMSLPKLRKLALENGINVFSEAKTAVSKRTGLPKKPKMVGCGTLMKRFKDAGLGDLVSVRNVNVVMDEPMQLFEEQVLPSEPSDPARPVGPSVPSVLSVPSVQLMQADPACAAAFQSLAEQQGSNLAQARFMKQYKGYAMGQGPCDKRDLIPRHIHGDEDDVSDYAEEAGFDMSYGRRYSSGARPKKTQKHVGVIVVKGRSHHVFKGKEGGLYYLKGRSGRKVYVDKERLKKKQKKN